MMMSTFTPYYRLSSTSRLGWVQSTTNDCQWSSLPPGLLRVTAMYERERDINNVKELADGSLMFSFGSSHSSGNAKRANSLSLSHAENVTSTTNSFPKRMPSNFKKQSPIPIAAVRKTGKSIRVPRQQDTGFVKVQDKFDFEKVTGETDNVNHIKRGKGLYEKISSAIAKSSSISSPKGRDSPEINKSYKSSGADDIIKGIRDSPEQNRSYNSSAADDIIKQLRVSPEQNRSYDSFAAEKIFRRIQNSPKKNRTYNSSAADDIIKRIRATVSNEKSANGEKSDNLSSKFKFRHPLPGSHQNPYKTKGEFKEYGSNRYSSIQDEEMPTRLASSTRGPTKQKYEKTSKLAKSSQPKTFVLSRPLSKFVRRSPVPLSAIKQYIRPVPGTQESETTSTKENGGISRDSDGTSTYMENGSLLKGSPSFSKGQQNDLNELKSPELKKMANSHDSVLNVSPSLSEGQQNDINELKLPELKKMAKSYGLKGYSTLRKRELLELLRITIKQS